MNYYIHPLSFTPQPTAFCDPNQLCQYLQVPLIRDTATVPQSSYSIFVRLANRIFSAPFGTLFGLDMLGRPLLYRQHHALVHHFRGPIPVPALPDAVRSQQDSAAGHPQNHLRVAALHRHESAPMSYVFQGTYTPKPQCVPNSPYLSSRRRSTIKASTSGWWVVWFPKRTKPYYIEIKHRH